MFINTEEAGGGGCFGEGGEEGGETAEDRPGHDRQRTCFLMSQLITSTPEWEKSRTRQQSVDQQGKRGLSTDDGHCSQQQHFLRSLTHFGGAEYICQSPSIQ